MPDKMVTLATFGTVEEAYLAKNFLEAEGIRTFLSDEATVGNLWHLGNAFGGVKLCVSDADLEQAERVLDRQDALNEESSPDGTNRPTAEPRPEGVDDRITSVQPADGLPSEKVAEQDALQDQEDEVEPPFAPGEVMASRAFRAAVLGLFVFPIAVYSLWLIVRLFFWEGELSDAGRYKLVFAFLINCIIVLFWLAFFRMF
jgi:hypothetical protein